MIIGFVLSVSVSNKNIEPTSMQAIEFISNKDSAILAELIHKNVAIEMDAYTSEQNRARMYFQNEIKDLLVYYLDQVPVGTQINYPELTNRFDRDKLEGDYTDLYSSSSSDAIVDIELGQHYIDNALSLGSMTFEEEQAFKSWVGQVSGQLAFEQLKRFSAAVNRGDIKLEK